MAQNVQIRELLQLPLDQRLDLLVVLTQSVTGEAKKMLPPGPVAHIAVLRNAAKELRRVTKIDYGYQQEKDGDG